MQGIKKAVLKHLMSEMKQHCKSNQSWRGRGRFIDSATKFAPRMESELERKIPRLIEQRELCMVVFGLRRYGVTLFSSQQ